MTIRYRNSFRDTLAFARYNYLHSWIVWVILGLLIAVTLPTTIKDLSPETAGQLLSLQSF